MFVSCYDIVKILTDEATLKFNTCCEDINKREKLQEICKMLDSFTIHLPIHCLEVEVTPSQDIIISLFCDEFETNASTYDFYRVIAQAKQITFGTTANGQIQMRFTFDGI